jgi:hypothetical protein
MSSLILGCVVNKICKLDIVLYQMTKISIKLDIVLYQMTKISIKFRE